MTPQEAFNTVRDHLLTQKQPSRSLSLAGNTTCMYRVVIAGGVLKCAIGALIPDEIYSEEIEHKGIQYLLETDHPCVNHLHIFEDITETQEFLAKLQEIHDHYDPFNWEEELTIFATDHNLEY